MARHDPKSLAHAARRFSTDPAFLGYLFRSAHLDNDGIASALRASPEVVQRLALCLCPRTDSPAVLQADVNEIADHFHFEPKRLLKLFREAQTLAALHSGQERGTIIPPAGGLAARDQEDTDGRDVSPPGPEHS